MMLLGVNILGYLGMLKRFLPPGMTGPLYQNVPEGFDLVGRGYMVIDHEGQSAAEVEAGLE